jgi:hypothetical protein
MACMVKVKYSWVLILLQYFIKVWSVQYQCNPSSLYHLSLSVRCVHNISRMISFSCLYSLMAMWSDNEFSDCAIVESICGSLLFWTLQMLSVNFCYHIDFVKFLSLGTHWSLGARKCNEGLVLGSAECGNSFVLSDRTFLQELCGRETSLQCVFSQDIYHIFSYILCKNVGAQFVLVRWSVHTQFSKFHKNITS